MATIIYVVGLIFAQKAAGPLGTCLLFAGVLSTLWLLQVVSIFQLPDCSLSALGWLKGIFLFSPNCEISARIVEPDQIAGFGFRMFFAFAITILSLPALLFAYRDTRT